MLVSVCSASICCVQFCCARILCPSFGAIFLAAITVNFTIKAFQAQAQLSEAFVFLLPDWMNECFDKEASLDGSLLYDGTNVREAIRELRDLIYALLIFDLVPLISCLMTAYYYKYIHREATAIRI